MKKIVSLILAITLVVTSGFSVAFADSWKNGQKKLPPGIAKKFKDTNGYDWAEQAIERMAIKGVIQGYGEGVYAPKNSVTKLEAIIMALRVMGYEELAKINLEKIRKGTKNLKNKNRVQEWAYGYVAVALEKGILDEVDLIEMDLRAPAQRHEVAKYIIRALGYEKEAQKYMKEELRFIDAGAVPLGSVGYVYLADKKGIITGYPDKTFRPNRSVTRAEMAVLIARLDDKVDSDIDENEQLAEIVKISGNKLTLKNDNGTKVYRVLENAPVYTENGRYVSIEELEKGMKIKIQLNDDGIIIFIEIKEYEDEKIFEEYIGIVEEIDDDEIEIKINTIKMEFDIEDDVKVEFNNKWGSIDDIKEGDKVKVRINDDEEVEYIKVYRSLDIIHYEGKVEELDNDSITIKVERIKMTFGLASNVKVKFRNREGSISDIRVGEAVKVRINKYDRVEYIEVNRNLDTWQYEGKVESVSNDNIAIKIDRVKMIFEYAENIKVKFNNREGSISDIKIGDTVKVRINKYKRVEYIEVNRNLDTWHYEGKVESVNNNNIAIKIDRVKMIFEYANNVKVKFNNREGSISDIRVGDTVKVRINKYKRVEYIEVNRNLDTWHYEGKVEDVDDDDIIIKLDRVKMIFEYANNVKVEFKNGEGSISDIRVGDTVKVRINKYKRVEYIEVNRNLDTWHYEGKIEDIDNDDITIKVDNIRMTFDLASNVKVKFENKYGTLEDLKVGDEVKVKINEDEKIELIEVDRELDTREYEGKVEKIDNDYDWIDIEIGSSDRRFEVTNETEVVFEDDVEGDIEDIEVGDSVKVRVNEDDELEYIEVEREKYYIYEGEVEEIDDGYDWIEIDLGSRDRRFEITDETEVVFEDDVEGDIEDIEVGDDVKVRVNADNEIEYIEVDREFGYDIYEGLFVEIDDEKLSIIQSNKIIEFSIDSDVKVKFIDKDGDLEDLLVGDEIKVITLKDDDEVKEIRVYRLMIED